MTLGDPPDPFDVLSAQIRCLTTFHSYSEPSLPSGSLRVFIDQAMSSLNALKKADHAELDDPILDGVVRYQLEALFPMIISLHLASHPPEADALTYYETGGVIASLTPYMRKWITSAPASVVLELWKVEGEMSEQKAAGFVFGFSKAADQ